MALERIIGGIPWAIGSFLGPRSVTFVSTIVLARFVSPADFGTFALGLLVFMAAATLADPGVGATMISASRFGPHLERAALGLVLLAATGLSTLVGAGLLVADRLGWADADTLLVFAAFTVALPVHALGSFHDSMLQRDLLFHRRFAAQNAQALVFPLVGIPLAVAGAGAWALAVGHIAGTVVLAVTATMLSRPVRPALHGRASRSLLQKGVGFLASGASGFLKSNVDYLAVGRFGGVTQLGFYSIAWRFAELPYLAVTEPVSRVMFAGMSHLRTTERGVRDTYRALLRFVALLGCPVGVVLTVAADPFVEVVLGDTWLPAGAVLAVLGLRSVLLPLTGMAVWMLNGAGLSRRIGTYTSVLLVPFAVAVAVAAALGGIVAVAYVLLADAVLWSALVIAVSARWSVVGLRDHLTVLAPLAVATAAAAFAGWAVADALDGRSPLVVLFGAASGALVAFLAVEVLLDRRGVVESVAVARGRGFTVHAGAGRAPD